MARGSLDYYTQMAARSRQESAARQQAKVASITQRNQPTYTPGGSPFKPRTSVWTSRPASGGTQWQSQISDLIQKMEDQAVAARTANLQRYDEAMGIYEKIESMYQPGGAFETAAMGNLERQKKQDLAYAAQQGVSSGLSQTTRQQYASQRWTQEVGAPATVQIQAQAQQLWPGQWDSGLGLSNVERMSILTMQLSQTL